MSNTHDISHFERLPNEIHANIAWYCSKQTTARISKASHTLRDVYSDLLYRNDVEHEDCNAMFAIAQTGEVESFEKLVHFSKAVLNKPMPDFNRYKVVFGDQRIMVSAALSQAFQIPRLLPKHPELYYTSLHLAVQHGNHAAAAYLLERGVHVNAVAIMPDPIFRPEKSVTDLFYTALHMAVCRNDLAMCQLLVNNGASMLSDPQNSNRSTVLHVAALCGHATIVKWLVQSGHVAINALYQSFGPRSVVQCAGSTRKGARILGLLQHLGADVTPAADVMVQSGKFSALLDFIWDSELRKRPGDDGTAFETQLLRKVLSMPPVRTSNESRLWTRVVVDLLDMGANVRHVTREGRTPLHLLLAHSGATPDLVVRFLEKGADPNAFYTPKKLNMLAYYMYVTQRSADDSRSVFSESNIAYEGSIVHGMINTLLDHGTDINACDYGLSALSWAVYLVCISGNTGPLTHLITRGANPSIGRSVYN
ncbi:ankyrin [Apiospora saccharicola]